jgi:hypothetical protein
MGKPIAQNMKLVFALVRAPPWATPLRRIDMKADLLQAVVTHQSCQKSPSARNRSPLVMTIGSSPIRSA